MAKNASNTFEWKTHDVSVVGQGGYKMRAGNTYNLLGGGVPLGQKFALYLDTSQTPVAVGTSPEINYFYEYSISPVARELDQTKFRRITGTGLQDLEISDTYTGTDARIYRIKIFYEFLFILI